jgi:monoamine oxidase
VLLASYTWSEDAQRWGSLSPHDRLEQALENVSLIHPQVLAEYEGGASKMWHDDEFACGAFALFDPGQQTLLHEHIIAPEGRMLPWPTPGSRERSSPDCALLARST